MAPTLTSVVNGSGATNKLSEISISVASRWKNTCFFYCSGDIVWFVHLSLRFPIYRITHSESFMVPQMVMSILSPPPLPGWADSCHLTFLSEPFEKTFLTFQIKHNVITNKSNWQEANLLEKLTWLGGGGLIFAGYMCRWPLRTCTHYTGSLFCDQK